MNDLYILRGEDRYYDEEHRLQLLRSVFKQESETNMNPVQRLFPYRGRMVSIGGCYPHRGILLKRKLDAY